MGSDVFAVALAYVLIFEGWYSCDPRDPGGETYRGISRRHHPTWPGWPIVDVIKRSTDRDDLFQKDLKLAGMVSDFYRASFWDKMRCGEMPPKVAAKVFESAVNLGCAWPIQTIQKILPIYTNRDAGPVDGIPGAMTIGALSGVNEDLIVASIRSNQMVMYETLCRQNPELRVYALGWHRRALN